MVRVVMVRMNQGRVSGEDSGKAEGRGECSYE